MKRSNAGGAFSRLRDGLRTQLWPLPTLGVVVALALGVGLPWLDQRIDENLPSSVTVWLFGGGADAARTVLSAIAASLITVTSLTFSLTVVTLQLASSQFSPRLLRTFARDRFVHVTLALFLSTFTFALTVLRTVRSADEDQQVFVPQLSVTSAFLLALASVIALVLFLAHLAREIRVETMLSNVHAEASKTVQHVVPGRDSAENRGLPVPPSRAVPLLAGSSGFLISMDEQALLTAAVNADVILLLDRQPGSFLVDGTAIGAGWTRDGQTFDTDTRDRLCNQVASAISTGFERTPTQDIGYGLRQITDVAVKALSPGINDPTTAVHALGYSSALLCELAGRDLGPRLLRDDEDMLRVALRRPDLADLLELAMTQPRRYGASDPLVLARLTTLLRDLACRVHDSYQRRAIADQLARVRATTAAQDFVPMERARLEALFDQVQQVLDAV